MTQSPAASSWRAPSQCRTTVPRLDQRRLAAAGLVHRRVAGAAGHRARARACGATARRAGRAAAGSGSRSCGRGRGPALAALAGSHDASPPRPRRAAAAARAAAPARAAIRVATCSVGLVSPRSTCESIGALTPERSREVAQRQVHRLAQRADPQPQGLGIAAGAEARLAHRQSSYKRTLSRTASSWMLRRFAEHEPIPLPRRRPRACAGTWPTPPTRSSLPAFVPRPGG